jgi:L-threonylcarbamoyladenylate synthase
VTAKQVKKSLGTNIHWILDGGKTTQGLESTIVDVTTNTPTVLRHGPITQSMLEAVIGIVLSTADTHASSTTTHTSQTSPAPKAPGMLLQHYAPRCPLRLTTDTPKPGEALLAFGPELMPQGFTLVLNLSVTGDLVEAAANLFDYLHQLEDSGATGIAVMNIPKHGLGAAIHDKLQRASHVNVLDLKNHNS